MSKTSKLPVLTLAETPHFSRHCHLVPAGQSGPKPTVQIRSSHTRRRLPFQLDPSEASVPTQPSPAQSTRTPQAGGPAARGARSPRWATPRSRCALSNRHPKAGGHPSFFTYPGRAGAWRLTREPAAFRNAETLLQTPT